MKAREGLVERSRVSQGARRISALSGSYQCGGEKTVHIVREEWFLTLVWITLILGQSIIMRHRQSHADASSPWDEPDLSHSVILLTSCSVHARRRHPPSPAGRRSPASPMRPTNPSKPHKPVLSSSSRVSIRWVWGVGCVVWANVGVVSGSSSRLNASTPARTVVETLAHCIANPF